MTSKNRIKSSRSGYKTLLIRLQVCNSIRCLVWGVISIIPFLNFYKLFLIIYRFSPYFRSVKKETVKYYALPSDCSICKQNKKLYNFNFFINNASKELCWYCGRRLIEKNQDLEKGIKGCSACNWWGRRFLFESWMSLKNIQSKCLIECVIPGTHNSAAYGREASVVGSWSTCQEVSIFHQLLMGIRFLDIRLRKKKIGGCPMSYSILTAHGTIFGTLDNAVQQIAAFFRIHDTKTEIIIVSIRPDWPKRMCELAGNEISKIFLNYFDSEDFLSDERELMRPIHELKQMNRKIALFSRDCFIHNKVPAIDSKKFMIGSWDSTQSTCASTLLSKTTSWVHQHCSKLDKKNENLQPTLKVLQGEITPDCKVIAAAYTYLSLTGDCYLNLADASASASRVLLSGLLQEWTQHQLNVVTQDYARFDIISVIIGLNFQETGIEQFTEYLMNAKPIRNVMEEVNRLSME